MESISPSMTESEKLMFLNVYKRDGRTGVANKKIADEDAVPAVNKIYR